MIKNDYNGPVRAVEGTVLSSLDDSDPYEWKAELTFEGDARPILRRMVQQFRDLGFKASTEISLGGPVRCEEGQINGDGNGRCLIAAYLHGGKGAVVMEVVKLDTAAKGLVKMTRSFEHRGVDDPIGPPYPKPLPGTDIKPPTPVQ